MPEPDHGGGAVGKWLVALFIAVAGVAAVAFGQGGSDRSAALELQSSAQAETDSAPSTSTSAVDELPVDELPVDADGQTAAVAIDGTALVPMPNVSGPTAPDVDSAIGQIAPTLVGTDFDGNQITIGPDGRMKAVYFLAHWCPHCQVELPTIQGLIDAGVKPDDIDVYGVSTAVSAERGNYPPEAWFAAEGWSSSVLRDDADASALVSYGAGGFPFVVFLDGENRVLTRAVGEMPVELMQQVWEIVAAGP